MESLGEARLLGFCRRTKNHRPDYFVLVHCSLHSAEILSNYHKGNVQDRFESKELILVDATELAQKLRTVSMPGCHRGGFELYQLYRRACSSAGGADSRVLANLRTQVARLEARRAGLLAQYGKPHGAD